MYDVLVLGSGVAGLTTALHAARAGSVGARAHQGRAVALGDALRAGRCRRRARRARHARPAPRRHADGRAPACATSDAVRILVTEGPDRVRELAELGAQFDTEPSPDGGRSCSSPARAATRSRASCTRAATPPAPRSNAALVEAVEHQRPIEVREGWFAIELLVERGRCAGVLRAAARRRRSSSCGPRDVVLATGGAGQCFAVTTNPTLSTGDGIALALKAGVACADLEFVQFHPDGAAPPVDAAPAPLGGAARRGRGAARRRRRRVHGRRASARRSRAPRRRRARDPPNACRRPAPTTSGSTRR